MLGGDVRKKIFAAQLLGWLLLSTLLSIGSASAAPAAECPDLITQSNQAYSEALTSYQNAITARDNYKNAGFSTSQDQLNQLSLAIDGTTATARQRIALSAEASTKLATNDCGSAAYSSKKNAITILAGNFNTEVYGKIPTDNQRQTSQLSVSMPEYTAAVNNPGQVECQSLADKANQQYASLLSPIANGHARAGDWSNAESLAAAQPTIDAIKSGDAQLQSTIQQMQQKNCDPALISAAQALQTKVADEATKIEQEHNATQGSLLGSIAQATNTIAKAFATCDNQCKSLKINPLIDSMVQSLCCLLSQLVQSLQKGLEDTASQIGTFLQQNT